MKRFPLEESMCSSIWWGLTTYSFPDELTLATWEAELDGVNGVVLPVKGKGYK